MKTNFSITFAISLLILFPHVAMAAGLSNVTTILTSVQDALQAVAVVTVTIAVLWAGYKVLFGGQTLREVAPLLLGGLLIGGGAQLASMLVGS